MIHIQENRNHESSVKNTISKHAGDSHLKKTKKIGVECVDRLQWLIDQNIHTSKSHQREHELRLIYTTKDPLSHAISMLTMLTTKCVKWYNGYKSVQTAIWGNGLKNHLLLQCHWEGESYASWIYECIEPPQVTLL